MKRVLTGLGVAAAMLWSGTALPCGGMFGPNATVSPSQTLVVAHKAGTETYVFRPHFCGESTEFGLILPVPSSLSKSPTLGDPELFAELDRITAPEVKKKQVCRDSQGPLAGGANPGRSNEGDGANVVDRGQVGIFDWALVKADSKSSFTEWLDTNGFPHAPEADTQFSHYVNEGWSFVAFKVSAGQAPPAGKKLCGDFGPIELAFPTDVAVVPTRIAVVSAGGHSPAWRIYGVTSSGAQLGVGAGQYPAMLGYSDELTASTLAGAPQLAKLGSPGDRLARLEVGFAFAGLAKDLQLTPVPAQKFRATKDEIEIIECQGTKPPTGGSNDPNDPNGGSGGSGNSTSSCAVRGGSGIDFALGALGVSLAIALLRRRQRRG